MRRVGFLVATTLAAIATLSVAATSACGRLEFPPESE